MFQRLDQTELSSDSEHPRSCGIVVAGPSSSLTVPGIIVSEVVSAIALTSPVIRIDVDLSAHPTVGLDRAPSLAATHEPPSNINVTRYRAPTSTRARNSALRGWIGPEVHTAIAYAWPGIDNGWIPQFIEIAKAAGASTAVICASLPQSRKARAVSLADTVSRADLVLVGDETEARELAAVLGSTGPVVESHRALALGGRSGRSAQRVITAFLPRENLDALSTLMAAFDAIPDARIAGHNLQVVMRYASREVRSVVANSYHAQHVDLISEDMSAADLLEICDRSSALGMAEPVFDSRAFSTAIDCGIATVVLAESKRPPVGRGYVGGLLANGRQPASVHVALVHALRLSELGFPNPDAWSDLAQRICGEQPARARVEAIAAPLARASLFPQRALEAVRFLEPTI